MITNWYELHVNELRRDRPSMRIPQFSRRAHDTFGPTGDTVRVHLAQYSLPTTFLLLASSILINKEKRAKQEVTCTSRFGSPDLESFSESKKRYHLVLLVPYFSFGCGHSLC